MTRWTRNQWKQRGVHFLLAAAVACGVWGGLNTAKESQAAVTWPTISLKLAASGLTSPVAITHADDNSGRLYIVEQGGIIRILLNGTLLAAPFLDVQSLVSCCGERGLLGLAFPPGYAGKSHFYVYYTDLNGNIAIARYNTSADRDLADPASRVPVLAVSHPTFANHNGGQLAFGPDGDLYAGVGDGGSGGDPNSHGQSLATLLAKILRLDVEGVGCVQNPPKTQNYCIPATNPFVSTSGAMAQIWAFGLRNPWRFSFDRQTGDLYIGDVGQDKEEEIDFQAAGNAGGVNYGWKTLEGNLCFSPATGCIPPANYSAPVATYDHNVGCAVTGGYVYRGPNGFIDMQGVYFYADYCAGRIYGLKNSGGWQTQLLMTAPFLISSFGEDEAGYIYVADYGNGALYLVTGMVNPASLTVHNYIPFLQK